jgi:hypothetical protein
MSFISRHRLTDTNPIITNERLKLKRSYRDSTTHIVTPPLAELKPKIQ